MNHDTQNLWDWVVVTLITVANWLAHNYAPEEWVQHLLLLLAVLKIVHQMILIAKILISKKRSHKHVE